MTNQCSMEDVVSQEEYKFTRTREGLTLDWKTMSTECRLKHLILWARELEFFWETSPMPWQAQFRLENLLLRNLTRLVHWNLYTICAWVTLVCTRVLFLSKTLEENVSICNLQSQGLWLQSLLFQTRVRCQEQICSRPWCQVSIRNNHMLEIRQKRYNSRT